jgi:hypothetical protein
MAMTDDRTRPNDTTREAERAEAAAPHEPDHMPTPDEERRAEEGARDVDLETTADHEREMAERGVNQQGEGRLP